VKLGRLPPREVSAASVNCDHQQAAGHVLHAAVHLAGLVAEDAQLQQLVHQARPAASVSAGSAHTSTSRPGRWRR
jgi:hypothetical protein